MPGKCVFNDAWLQRDELWNTNHPSVHYFAKMFTTVTDLAIEKCLGILNFWSGKVLEKLWNFVLILWYEPCLLVGVSMPEARDSIGGRSAKIF